MNPPVQFVLDNDTLYAIGSKGDHYEIHLESPDGQEAFCSCEGFKWINTDTRRDARPGRAIKDCKHLIAARDRAQSAHVSPRFRLYHPPTNSVLADKFQSIEAMGFMLISYPGPVGILPYPLTEIEIQRFDEVNHGWLFVRMASDTPATIDKGKDEENDHSPCEVGTEQRGRVSVVCQESKSVEPEEVVVDHHGQASDVPTMQEIDGRRSEPASPINPRKSRKKETPTEPPKEQRPPSYYCRTCEVISPAIEWINDQCPKCSRPYDYKGRGVD